MNKTVIIVAGGSGMRMKSAIPKQFLLLRGIPVLMHTVNTFHRYDQNMSIRLVLPQSQFALWAKQCSEYNFNIPVKLFSGGKTRFHSVLNGLKDLPPNGLIAIHDGVRPLVSTGTIKNCFEAANTHGAAIPVVPVDESIRKLNGEKSISMDRVQFRLVQTPQVFRADILLNAYKVSYSNFFTDDASVVEYSGCAITLVDGNTENMKITNPNDIAIAEVLMDK